MGKVAEISADGRRAQIFMALSTAAEFRDQLSAFSDFYSSLGPPNPDTAPEDGKLKSEMMIKDNPAESFGRGTTQINAKEIPKVPHSFPTHSTPWSSQID